MAQDSVLDKAHELLSRRLTEIDEERRRLERALAELGTKAARGEVGRPRRPKASTGRSSGKPKRRRKRRSGGRADQAVRLITKSPGVTASQIAKKLKVKPTYLYRVLGDLEKDGRVRKDGRRYHPLS